MTARALWQRHRTTLLILAGVAAALAVVLATGGGARTSTPLDPDNPGGDGAQAVARVLEDRGVDVVVARGADAFEATAVDAGTTVVVTSTDLLGRSTTRRLLRHADAADIVLVEAGPGLSEALGGSAPERVPVGDGRSAGCADPRLDGLEVEVDSAWAYPGDGCFDGDGGALVVARADATLLGAGQALTNDQVLRADNAAVALRLLGQHDRLVWYVPEVEDLVGDDGVSLQTLLPRWLRPGLWLGVLTLVALLFWRGRRLGPLATEPLPVVVRAIETTRSRGRLYRRAGDRAHAAEALRAAARRRVAGRLRLGDPDPATLVGDVARHLGRPVAEVAALLGPAPPPGSDHDLLTLANDLAALEEEVRRP